MTIVCDSCSYAIIQAKDSGGDPTDITFYCDCGNVIEESFLGFPFLGTTETHFFDLISESEYKCLRKP